MDWFKLSMTFSVGGHLFFIPVFYGLDAVVLLGSKSQFRRWCFYFGMMGLVASLTVSVVCMLAWMWSQS